MAKLYGNILGVVGDTPLVRLTKIFADCDCQVSAKLESSNPGGSIKDRPALNIIESALGAGVINPSSTVIESSSGNMGIGLAQVCAYYKLRLICVVDPKATSQNIAILKALGATVDIVTKRDAATGEYLPMRIARVKELVGQNPGSFWPDQYSTLANAEAHFVTMREISEAFDDKLDYVFCAVSTCGTLAGCASYIRRHNLPTKLWAVDALGSVIFGGGTSRRLIPGHGASIVPPLYQTDMEDDYIQVTDADCIRGCRSLVREEGILAGGSSGAIVAAFRKVKERIPEGSTCVLILADRGERYLERVS
jgi:2,3-diaminopropionate biosynthesis protein SbnA